MRDFVVDIAEPVFIFTLTDFPKTYPVDEPVQMTYVPSADAVMQPAVTEVVDVNEIMLLRAAAEEALNNDSR